MKYLLPLLTLRRTRRSVGDGSKKVSASAVVVRVTSPGIVGTPHRSEVSDSHPSLRPWAAARPDPRPTSRLLPRLSVGALQLRPLRRHAVEAAMFLSPRPRNNASRRNPRTT